MPINCCVLGCFDKGKYALPYKCPIRWKKWLKSCPYLQQYSLRQLEDKRICSKHFIPEHFDLHKNSLSKQAVPLLNLPKCSDEAISTTEEAEEAIEIIEEIDEEIETIEETKETVEAIEDCKDLSICFSPIGDESTHYDNEECIPVQQSEETEFDPLKISPKQSPIDFDDYEESVIATTPPPKRDLFKEPPQLIEHSKCSSIIKPQPVNFQTLIPKVVLQRLPPNLKRVRVCPLPPLKPKPKNSTIQKKQNGNQTLYFNRPLRDSITFCNSQGQQIGPPPALVPGKKYNKLFSKTYSKKLCPHTRLYLEQHHLSSSFGQTLTNSHIRLTGTVREGVHYTTKEKILALSLAKLNPKGYDFLENYLDLPSKENINLIVEDIPLRSGINDFIFQHLADVATHKTDKEKECALLFGEMKIDKFLKFNVYTGIIEGLQDLGSGKRANNVGDKALVFILCGLYQLWKLPIAYYFTRDLIENNNVILQRILYEIVKAIFETGFVVKATVSDHSPTNVKAINSLLADNDNSEDNMYYEIDNKQLFHIYDVTKILESLTNDSKNDKHQNSHSKWDFLETLFQADNAEKGDETQLKMWDSALRKLNSMKFDSQEENAKLSVKLLINNVKTIKEVWVDLQAKGGAFVRYLNLKPLNFLFLKIRKHEHNTNINSNQFIKAYRSILINSLTSGKLLDTDVEINDYKILSMLKNLTKKYSSYYDDIDLENILYYVNQISTKFSVVQALFHYFMSHKPYKDCSQCLQSIYSSQIFESTIWKSIHLVHELLPEMVNIQIYHLILILQQEIDTSWFVCTIHKMLFFNVFWAYIIKVKAKKWCSEYRGT